MLLGLVLAVTRVPIVYLGDAALTPELRVVFTVNTLVLLVVTGLFARLLFVLDARDATEASPQIRACRTIACAALWTWCAIRLIAVTTITPDVLLAGWLFLVSTELVQASSAAPRRRRAVRLATALALGYCTKAVFFPVMLVGALAYLLSIPKASWRAHLPWLIAPMLAIAGPLVLVQSVSQGHLSFGETGRLNYAWYVNGVPHAPAKPELVDTTRAHGPEMPAVVQLKTDPQTALYVGTARASFPYWYDPSRFEEKATTTVSFSALTRVVRANLFWYRVVAGTFAWLCAVAITAALARQRLRLNRTLAMAPALSLLALYALTHPEGRLAGPAVADALVMSLYLAGPRRRCVVGKEGMWGGAECTALLLLVVLAFGRTSNRVPLQRGQPAANPIGELARVGIPPGTRVGVIGSPYGHYWAHQSGVRIATVREADVPKFVPGGVELEAVASESCARGAPLAAILWQGRGPGNNHQGIASSNDWVVWKVRSACNRHR
jgi:hypothetical protein